MKITPFHTCMKCFAHAQSVSAQTLPQRGKASVFTFSRLCSSHKQCYNAFALGHVACDGSTRSTRTTLSKLLVSAVGQRRCPCCLHALAVGELLVFLTVRLTLSSTWLHRVLCWSSPRILVHLSLPPCLVDNFKRTNHHLMLKTSRGSSMVSYDIRTN